MEQSLQNYPKRSTQRTKQTCHWELLLECMHILCMIAHNNFFYHSDDAGAEYLTGWMPFKLQNWRHWTKWLTAQQQV